MKPKTTYLLIVVMAILALCGSRVRAECIEFTTDGVIETGDVYGCVRILNDATVDMTGGTVTNYIALYDTGTLNLSGGSVDRIWANDSSTINITGGNLNGLYIWEQSSANIYDVEMTDGYLVVYEQSTLNIYGGNMSFGHAKIHTDAPVNIFAGSVSFDYTNIDATLNILGGNINFANGLDSCPDNISIYGHDFNYDPNSLFFAGSLLYAGQITISHLPPSEYECLNLVVTPPGVVEIVRTLRQKSETLGLIDQMLRAEYAAYDALDELLQTGDYGDFTKRDVVEAKQRVHSAIRHELQSEAALEKSIDKLNDALSVLNWQAPPPYIPPPQ